MVLKGNIQVEAVAAICEPDSDESVSPIVVLKTNNEVTTRVGDRFDGDSRIFIDRTLAEQLATHLVFQLQNAIFAFSHQSEASSP